jgi:hypothetical protein
MRRKLIQFSRYSLGIILPKQWLENFGLQKGSAISLRLKNSDVIIKVGEGVASPTPPERVSHKTILGEPSYE